MSKDSIKMVDTNVILRLLLADVKEQYKEAKLLFSDIESGKKKVYVSVLVIGELVWILEKYYAIARNEFIEKILAILAMKNVKVFEADKKLVVGALRAMLKYNMDFTDLYLWKTGMEIVSFDKKLNKLE